VLERLSAVIFRLPRTGRQIHVPLPRHVVGVTAFARRLVPSSRSSSRHSGHTKYFQESANRANFSGLIATSRHTVESQHIVTKKPPEEACGTAGQSCGRVFSLL
jgi:hypothetical protein